MENHQSNRENLHSINIHVLPFDRSLPLLIELQFTRINSGEEKAPQSFEPESERRPSGPKKMLAPAKSSPLRVPFRPTVDPRSLPSFDIPSSFLFRTMSPRHAFVAYNSCALFP